MTIGPTPALLDGVVRHYDWGSTDAIPWLLGREPDGRPWAELWFGAHEADPSPVVEQGIALDAVVARDPDAVLGREVAERFGGRLPFLLKILAAASPLSIQVHPTKAQAEAGFAAEERAGLNRDAPERTYRDDNHKPELLCALSPFEALCGFAPVDRTRALLDRLALPELGFVRDALDGPDPLRTAFTAVVTSPDTAAAVDAVTRAASPDGPLRPAYLAAAHFPGDVGIVLTLLLNHVHLDPGQAIFLGAGNVHAYLQGLGVEIMAASDNVLRCGLTSKHVDVDELLRVTDFAPLAEPLWAAGPDGFSVPVPDFRLVPGRAGSAVAPAGVPSIVLCTEGMARVGEVPLAPGHAAFVPADAGEVGVTGDATVFVATVGD